MNGYEIIFYTMIASMVFFLAIYYILVSLSTMFTFKVMGVKSGLAFIPIYSTYRLLSEYKGRVYKSNWGVLYLISWLLTLLGFVLIGGIILDIFYNLSSVFPTGPDSAIYGDLGTFFIGLFLLIIFGIITRVISFLTLYPVMYTTAFRVIYIVGFIFSIFSGYITSLILNDAENVTDFTSFILVCSFEIFLIIVAYNAYAKVRNGEKKVVLKLDMANMNPLDVQKVLYARDKKLIQDLDFENLTQEPVVETPNVETQTKPTQSEEDNKEEFYI